jgi:hypothetical protein
VIIGLVLRRRGLLRTRGAWLGWTLLCGVPLLVSIIHSWTDRLPTTVGSPPTAGTDTNGVQPPR